MPKQPIQRKITHVLAEYGLESKRDFSICHFSMANEVVYVTDTKGRRWVLKNNLKNRSPELLDLEFRLAEHLIRHGCGAPEYLASKSGAGFVAYEDEFWTICRRFEGQFCAADKPVKSWQIEQMVVGLASYHRASSAWQGDFETGRISDFDIPAVQGWVRGLDEQLERDQSGRQSVALMRPLMPEYRSLAQELPQLLPAGAVDRLERLVVHGDFHPWNVLYQHRRFKACFDFDFVRKDCSLFDIAYAFNHVFFHAARQRFGKAAESPEFQADFDEELAVGLHSLRWMAASYQRIRPIGAAEWELLPAMAVVLPLYFLRFFNLGFNETECLEQQHWASWGMKRLERERRLLAAIVEQYLRKPVRPVHRHIVKY